jgi:hypothetical protein
MKKLLLLVFLFSAVAFVSHGQGEVGEALNPVSGAFATFAALTAVIPLATEFLKRILFKDGAGGFAVQLLSWITGIVLTLFGWWLGLGFLSDMSLWMALLYGLGASLAANGVFDTDIITALFDLLRFKV